MSPSTPENILLIATVGGSPAPLAASILHWKPDRVLFIPSVETADGIGGIHGKLEENEYILGEGQYATVPLSDPQDFSQCVREMRSGLESQVAEWRGRGPEYGCIVDFTGGTKCMSAALALVARPWHDSLFSYVGGDERDKDNVGIVISGREQVVNSANPWDSLGYQVIEDAVAAFDRHAFGEGARLLRNATIRIKDDDSRKSELCTLAIFMDVYDFWSQSKYPNAFHELVKCEKRFNDLAAALSPLPRHRIRGYIGQAKSRLKLLMEPSDHPIRALLEDLISDAERRRSEGRHVDAVARLYRAVEATAQLRLWDEYKVLTRQVAIEDLPDAMRGSLEKQSKDGTVKLALQGAYEFLIQKQDPLGAKFACLGWNGIKSPLSMRNDSIAGHGFTPVSQEISDKLWKGTLELAGMTENEVFRFPRLGQREG